VICLEKAAARYDLIAFDLDDTLIHGYLEKRKCTPCGGTGNWHVPGWWPVPGPGKYRHPDHHELDLRDAKPGCSACHGTGKRLENTQCYEKVLFIARRIPALRYLWSQGVKLGIATNQTGVGFGYHEPWEVLNKLARVRQQIGVPMLQEFALCAPGARPPYDRPEFWLRRKPGPDMLNRLIRHAGVLNSRTLFVGDMLVDEQAARNVGLAGIDYLHPVDFFGPTW